ncbi:putative tRNA 2'-phosphotransferase [Amborella trichopoda]|nr:putative tRNA 2'-phosphotransferase [Amborella trichopoda]XP_020522257.1 putative tRNA 2'-phosphotransferase [Amborella trichopoda]XP_020522258.1 putative tRNA 2'-phosphotransferase [Amborella trichopoda]XP_020522259.1 putative tRNA 2'-phosphotransferase [Amborella trichopoda]XP_020522260.1 putative tRNA 2'-phosphotransferase [Amborella trichopoda]XP_020522261.1 putative tRNA 2'-phosphotransferase [Amborella trichopoda]|eukprot:XP_020522256.1 putative tRNA 2'-phosphotransferase [Amborella trichopoda]
MDSNQSEYTEKSYTSDGDNPWCEEETFDDKKLSASSDLQREWERRHSHFHTIGYRDGIMAGKEASAQDGFNAGFKQSVLVGYNWGLVRGITSALACLPDDLRETMVGTLEKSNRLQELHENVKSISTKDALKLFHNDIVNAESENRATNLEEKMQAMSLLSDAFGSNKLEDFSQKLDSILRESPIPEVNTLLNSKVA